MAQWKIDFNDLGFEERIGQGNFGEVWHGSYLGTDVAIKKLFFVDDDFMQKYIEREMDTLTCLNHPNIVQLMGLCIGMDDMYIITEFITGGDLRSRLKDPSIEMGWKLRVGVLRDIALAMNYLHAKGIIHRDLKSHNLLVGDDWKVKVCDFGLARSAPNNETQKAGMTIVGTNEWMAPEVAMGEGYDNTCDVFSFGMVAFELITRDKPPMRKIREGYAFIGADHQDKIPAETPPELWQLLLECAATSPKDRPNFKTIVSKLKDIYDSLPEDDKAKPKKKKKKAKRKPSGKKRPKKKVSGKTKKKKKKPAA
eukprot:CAMPEP_0174250414 /NCGR_PEP_ID=MMETSP0439-20130205/593_1 /TAXON_ID=0 /ORGANISM="Stereomyxa ramosa, Strain Chinc5" /LENGTH=309 /DNA_ID=CAMNT_0015330477 /DNA_START=27 /DNA_END=956 /DNA_ORIENTATION=+